MIDAQDKFIVTERDGRWTLRATGRQIRNLLAICAIAIVFGLGFVTWSGLKQDLPSVVFGCLVAAVSCGIGIWAWSVRNAALVIDTETGAVYLGNRQICPPGTVEAVVLHRDKENGNSCPLDFLLTDGRRNRVHSPLFANMGDLAYVLALAARAAEKLHVGVLSE